MLLGVGLLGYLGYRAYPRFDLPAVEGPGLLVLAAGAGVGGAVALGGRTLVGNVTFTSPAGRLLRVVVGLFLVGMGLVQLDRLPNPLHAVVGDALRPLLGRQAATRREHRFLGHTVFGFGYLLAGFG